MWWSYSNSEIDPFWYESTWSARSLPSYMLQHFSERMPRNSWLGEGDQIGAGCSWKCWLISVGHQKTWDISLRYLWSENPVICKLCPSWRRRWLGTFAKGSCFWSVWAIMTNSWVEFLPQCRILYIVFEVYFGHLQTITVTCIQYSRRVESRVLRLLNPFIPQLHWAL